MEELLLLLVPPVAGTLVYKSKRFRDKLRAVSWGANGNYVRFWPNPGFKLGKKKWSKFYGWKVK